MLQWSAVASCTSAYHEAILFAYVFFKISKFWPSKLLWKRNLEKIVLFSDMLMSVKLILGFQTTSRPPRCSPSKQIGFFPKTELRILMQIFSSIYLLSWKRQVWRHTMNNELDFHVNFYRTIFQNQPSIRKRVIIIIIIFYYYCCCCLLLL